MSCKGMASVCWPFCEAAEHVLASTQQTKMDINYSEQLAKLPGMFQMQCEQ